MTDIDNQVTFEERYIVATTTSDLGLSTLQRKAADVVIAVGLAGRPMDEGGAVPEHVVVRHHLASSLLRLQQEWDVVKGLIDRARAYVSPFWARSTAAADAMHHGKIALHGPTKEAYWSHLADHDEASAIGGARAEAMMSLKTLAATKATLHRWAEIEATRKGFMVTDAEVARIVGPVLETHLDPNCHKCGGRGRLGRHGTVQKICPVCNGTGRRGARKGGHGSTIGGTPEQHRMSAYMLAEIGQMLAQMRMRSANYLRGA